MREILFKAKRLDNGEWVEGYYVRRAMRLVDSHGCLCPTYSHRIYRTDEGRQSFYAVDPETVCQFTSLTDSKGKKVFEGDILKFFDKNEWYEWTGRVEFGNPNGGYTWGWQLVWMSGEKPSADTLLWFDMEESGAYNKVIGNIHDKED